MKCKECQIENPEGKKFCYQCGSQLDKEEIVDNLEVVDKPEMIDKPEVVQRKTDISLVQKFSEIYHEIGPKKVLAVGISVIAILGIIVAIPHKEKVDKRVFTYMEDNDTYYTQKGKEYIEIGQITMCASDSESLIYMEDGDLYYVGQQGDADRIDKDVEYGNYDISKDGKKVVYLKDTEYEDGNIYIEGELCYWDGRESVEIDDSASQGILSSSGEYIAYMHKQEEGKLSVKGKEATSLKDIQWPLAVNDKGKVLGLELGEDNYVPLDLYIEQNGKSDRIGRDIISTIYSKDLETIYMLDEDGKLLYYGGNKAIEVAEDVIRIAWIDQTPDEICILVQSADDDAFVMFGDEVCYELGDYVEGNSIIYTQQQQKFTYMSDGHLYVDIKKGKELESERIAKDVSNMALSPNGEYGAYISDEELYIYRNHEEPIEITDDAEDVTHLVVSDRGDMWYLDKDKTLYYVTEKSKEPVELADDIINISESIDSSILCLDEDRKLYQYTQTEESDRIAKDVTSIGVNDLEDNYYTRSIQWWY